MFRIHAASLVLGISVWACSGTVAEHLTNVPSMDTAKVSRDTDPDVLVGGSASEELGNVRLRSEVCQSADMTPERQILTAQSIVDQLKKHGFETKIEYAREDLTYVEVLRPQGSTRLRVATLLSAEDAGRELHEAILQHGPGSWGIHRSNLAVLGPIGSVSDILALVEQTKLACWGVLTVSGLDDSFVIPGGYTEL